MKKLVIALVVWAFFGAYSFNQFGSINLMLSINMVLVSLIAVRCFSSYWVTLLLIISISNFLNEIIPILNITPHTNLLSALTTILILIVAYSHKFNTKWNL